MAACREAIVYIQAKGCGYNFRFVDASKTYQWCAEGSLPDYIKKALPANAERDSEVRVKVNIPPKNGSIGACMKAESVPDETREDEEDIMPTQEKDVTYNGRVEIHAGSLCLVTERSKGLNECYTSYGTFPKDLPEWTKIIFERFHLDYTSGQCVECEFTVDTDGKHSVCFENTKTYVREDIKSCPPTQENTPNNSRSSSPAHKRLKKEGPKTEH